LDEKHNEHELDLLDMIGDSENKEFKDFQDFPGSSFDFEHGIQKACIADLEVPDQSLLKGRFEIPQHHLKQQVQFESFQWLFTPRTETPKPAKKTKQSTLSKKVSF
jgi:hypothetical protein